jgi:hypothetical protein
MLYFFHESARKLNLRLYKHFNFAVRAASITLGWHEAKTGVCKKWHVTIESNCRLCALPVNFLNNVDLF